MERGGVDARFVEQARELLAPEADARLRALLDQPLVIRARGRVGIDPVKQAEERHRVDDAPREAAALPRVV